MQAENTHLPRLRRKARQAILLRGSMAQREPVALGQDDEEEP